MILMMIQDQHLSLSDRDHEEIWDYVLRSDNREYLRLLLLFPKKFSMEHRKCRSQHSLKVSGDPRFRQLILGGVPHPGNESTAITSAVGPLLASNSRKETGQGPTAACCRRGSQHDSWMGPFLRPSIVSVPTSHVDSRTQ